MEQMSIRGFAQKYKLSDTTVRRYIQDGKLTDGVRYANGKPYLIESLAASELGLTAENDSPPEVGANEAMRAKQQQEILKAEKLRLEVEEMQGKLVEKEAVKRNLYAMGKEISTNLLNVPGRVAPYLIGLKDLHDIEKIIHEAIEAELNKLAQIVSRDVSK